MIEYTQDNIKLVKDVLCEAGKIVAAGGGSIRIAPEKKGESHGRGGHVLDFYLHHSHRRGLLSGNDDTDILAAQRTHRKDKE